jgi:Secretion system C-terminal sorting domain
VNNANSGYQFWFFNPDGGYTRRLLQTHAVPGTFTGAPANIRASYLKLNSIVTTPLPVGTLLNVRVRRQVNGVYSEFGPACRFKIPAQVCQTTQLTTTATPVVSCGATVLLGSTIYATPVAGANYYRFSFSRLGYARNAGSATNSLVLANWSTLPLLCGFTYNVTVAASFDGGATYCPVGPVCQLTVACPAQAQSRVMEGAQQQAELTIWPNPNNGGQVFIALSELNTEATSATVDIFDMFGKRVMAQRLATQGSSINTVIDLEHQLAPGMYVVTVTAGEASFTQRLMIQ